MKHLHHIVPRHAGGREESWNIADLEVSEHAEAHLKRFFWFNDNFDLLAYKALSGQVGKEEIIEMKLKEAGKRGGLVPKPVHFGKSISKALSGKLKSEEHKANISESRTGGAGGFKDKTHSEETRKGISEKLKGKEGNFKDKSHSKKSRNKISESKKGCVPPNRKQVEIDGMIYKSIKEAVDQTGISAYKIRKLMGGE